MELILTRQTGTQVLVTCDNQPSHTFDLLTLLPHEKGLPQPLDDPVAYGQAVYAALFPPETLAQRALANAPERILLITTDNDLDTVSWEYAYGLDGFLVLECHFVRGLSPEQRITPPTVDTSLHIVAVPSNPLSQAAEALDIDGEWMRLKDIIQHVPYTVTLERTRPPTIEQVRTLVANQRHRVIHFMGHGGQDEQGAFLYFEQDNGDLDPVTARQFVLRVRGTVFLVTLNACVSATPGATTFSNLAASLVRQKTPYALGMRFSIPDEDARAFSRVFYNDLARGSSVEEALLQARLTLANSPHSWAVGVPVFYTALTKPSAGFASIAGTPTVKEHQPRIEVSALSRAEGAFQGRIDELKVLGTALTGDSRPPLVTIHGAGGQGKTALAREAVERFAYAWPGGVWATSLENLPSRELFVSDLTRFLGIDTQTVADPAEVERLVIAHLVHRRTSIVLDNVETLIEAVEGNNEGAIRLAQFLREQVPRPPVCLLVTSRAFLGWTGEIGFELTGLAPIEGMRLFQQYAPQRRGEIDQAGAWQLSEKVEGHPLSLRLLGSAFNASSIPFSAFVQEYEAQLLKAEDKYKDVDHRHRTLYACIDMSARYLGAELHALFSKLWIFHAPFQPEAAVSIFDPPTEGTQGKDSPIYNQLHTLWLRGLLTRETAPLREGTPLFYRLLPAIRLYVEQYLAHADERESLLERFGAAYAQLVRFLYYELNHSIAAVAIAQKVSEDLERALLYVSGTTQSNYLLYWGGVLQRLGDPVRGLKLTEQALEIAQSQNRQLELLAHNNMALAYRATGQPERALVLYERILPVVQQIGDPTGEAAILNNTARVYQAIGQPHQALMMYEQALPIIREVGDRAGEATILDNIAGIYSIMGEPQRALELFEQILRIRREVGDVRGEASTLNNLAEVRQMIGQPQQALELFEQALPIMREMGDRTSEATTLSNMAQAYFATGQMQQALDLHQRALFIRREISDRAGEANTLKNMAQIYLSMGQSAKALALFEQVLPIVREVSDRAGEAATLSGMAETYRTIGQLQQALDLFEQVLLIVQKFGNRAGEAATLSSMALVHHAKEKPQRALELYKKALRIQREVGDRRGEATTLHNMAGVYFDTGHLLQALGLFEQALLIRREVNDRVNEAATLNGLAHVLQNLRRYEEGLAAFEQSVSLARLIGHRVSEATGLVGLGALLHQHLNRRQEAIVQLEQAIAILTDLDLPQGVAGQKVEDLQQFLEDIRREASLEEPADGPATMPASKVLQIVANTIAMMTSAQDSRAEWRKVIVDVLREAQSINHPQDAELFTAVLDVIDGRPPTLPTDHPYAQVIAAIQEGIAMGGKQKQRASHAKTKQGITKQKKHKRSRK